MLELYVLVLIIKCFFFVSREFFKIINPPDERGEFLDKLLEMFANRFCCCNPHFQFTQGKTDFVTLY